MHHSGIERRPRQITHPTDDIWVIQGHEDSPKKGFALIVHEKSRYTIEYALDWWIYTDPEKYQTFEEAYEQCDLQMIAVEQDLMCVD